MIQYPFTDEGVTAALATLGETPNQVAANLQALGFRGTRADSDDCPLVHYLAAVFPQVHTILVGGLDAHFYSGFGVDTLELSVPHTAGTKAFLDRFDSAGAYPELEYGDLIEEEKAT